MGGKAVLLALTAALALLGLCAQVSARARPPVVPAASAAMPMAEMDAACMEAMRASAEAQQPGRMDMTLDCIAKHGCIVVALVVEAAPLAPQAMPPPPPGPVWSMLWHEGSGLLPEVQPPIAA